MMGEGFGMIQKEEVLEDVNCIRPKCGKLITDGMNRYEGEKGGSICEECINKELR